MDLYRVKHGNYQGKFSYGPGDIIEATSQEAKNSHFGTMNNLEKRDCKGCESFYKNSGGKPYCEEFQNVKHPYCVKDPKSYK